MRNFIISIGFILIFGCGNETGKDLYVDNSKYYSTKILEGDTILIKNGNFEEGDLGWAFYKAEKGRIIGQEGRDNSKGVIVTHSTKHLTCTFAQSITNTLKVSEILFEGWIKTSGLKGEASYSVECINYKYSNRYKIGDDKIKRPIYGLLNAQGSERFSGDTPWVRIAMKVYVPIETEEIILFCSSQASEGIVYFDDIVVKGLSVYDGNRVRDDVLPNSKK